jgi:hypothetical protein
VQCTSVMSLTEQVRDEQKSRVLPVAVTATSLYLTTSGIAARTCPSDRYRNLTVLW